MRTEIVNFLKDVCTELGLSANYSIQKDMYTVHKRGFAVQNFTQKQFYQIPKPVRRRDLRALLKRGLVHNIGENSTKENLRVKTQLGLRII